MDAFEKFFNHQAAVRQALSDHPKLKGPFTKAISDLNRLHELRIRFKETEKRFVAASLHEQELEQQIGVSHTAAIQADIDKVTKAIRHVKDRLETELVASGRLLGEHFEHAITLQLGNLDNNLLKPKQDETLVDALVRAVIERRTDIPEYVVRNVNRRLRHLEKENAKLAHTKQELEDQLADHHADLTNLNNMLAGEEDRLTDLHNEYEDARREARSARIAMNNLEKEINGVLKNTWETFYSNIGLSHPDTVKFLNRYLSSKSSWSLPSI